MRRCPGEYQAVEHRVDHVADGSCGDDSHQQDISTAGSLLNQLYDVVAQPDDGHQTEQTEEQLVDEGHAEGHAVVLDVVNLEPRGNLYRVVEGHGGLDPDFDNLVDD